MEYSIHIYETESGKLPFYDWLEDLDFDIKQKIRAKLRRISLGNFGNCEPVGEGVSELKIDMGPGYRIYFSMIGIKIVLIIYGGTKRTQSKDIEKAKKYLNDFQVRGKKYGKK